MDSENIRHRISALIAKRPRRPFLSPEQRLLTLIFTVGATMVLGGTGAVAGLVLLLLSALASSVLGVIISSGALVGGAALVFAGYIWFTS
jgi:hypothetical protein